MTSSDAWSFATARVPARFGAAIRPAMPGVQHAIDGRRTLCGLRGDRVEVYLHLFDPDDLAACPRCRERSAAAPTQPGTQERLHDRVTAADPGPVRDDLLDALRRGAAVKRWINGPASSLARHHVRLDQAVDGGPEVAAALRTDDSVGVATVVDDAWRFVVVLPDDGPPVIARTRTEGRVGPA